MGVRFLLRVMKNDLKLDYDVMLVQLCKYTKKNTELQSLNR